MNKLSHFLVEQMLLEDENPIKKVVVIYGGRFQPFHKGHYGTYSHLVKKFGKDNVFISTSNKVEKPKSPFNYKEKVQIISTMFNIPKSKIVQVKNNYAPTEILKKYDKNTTAFITVVGEKDAGRLGGKYFQPWKGKAEVGYEDGGYVYAAPSSGGGISGTETRNGLSVGSDEQKKSFFKSRAYGKFNATIFKMITDKLNEGVIEIPKERIEDWLINESSNLAGNAGSDVDDGPSFFFPNYDVFSRVNVKRAQKIGWEVINMITTKEIEDYYDHPNYPDGPVKAVSFFPAGVIGNKTPNNQVDIYSSGAYSQWYKHATRNASLVGYSLVSDPNMKDDKKQSGDLAKGDKELKDEFEASLNENINIPVKVGDTILTGRFKNKKTVVKSIGKDEHGMPTINGKKVVTFRLVNEGFHAIFEDEKEDEKYTHVGNGNYKLKGKEKDPKSPTFQKDDNGKYTELEKDGETKSQTKTGKALKTKDFQNKVKKEKETRQKMNGDDDSEKQEPKQDNWEKVDDKNNYYKSVRKYTDEELEDETGEYFENETTMKTAPNAFKDKADMIEKMKNAKPVYLSSEEMENMNNTDMGDILKSDNPKQTAKERADSYKKDISWQYDSIEKGEKVPAPIALRDKNGEYHLLAGNTRAMAFTAAGRKLPIKVIDYDGEFQYQEEKNESINEIAGTAVKCEKCNHSWEIESEDTEKYLCHSCGWDSQKQEYDYAAFDSWAEKSGLFEAIEHEIDERGGKLRPAAILRRKAALAGKRAQIAIRKKRTMMRKKPLSKLRKIAYKMAYRQVYDEFAEKLFPGIPKSDLTIQQTKVVHRNVLRKKKRVLKRARFRFLPTLRDKEVDKFGGKSNLSFDKPKETSEMSMSQLKGVERYAEKQLSPEDIEFTKHFFDRINDPRNGKEITDAELTGFFKRLSKYKKQFRDFLEKYKQIVVTDKRNSINIPFVKQANQIIAKTVMRKDDFKTSNPKLAFEQLAKGMTLKDIADKHGVSFEELSKEAKKGVKVEMEHTSDVKQAYNIAKDHLFEDPKYYTKLASIEEVGVGTGQSGVRMGYPSKDDLKKIEKRVQKQRSNTDSNQEYQYQPITEQSDRKTQCINDFVEYASKRLKLKEIPKINLLNGTEYSNTFKSLGGFNQENKQIYVSTENRLTADICRTLAHELVHRKQDELGLIKNPIKDGKDGSPIENQAHAVAGIIMREYGRINSTIYQEGKELQRLDENKATRTKFNLTIPSDILKLQKAFKKNKKELYVVGGAVRDALLGKKPKDFDLTTDATPEEMIKIAKEGNFKHSTTNVNANLGLGSIIINGHEVTTFREDIGKGRRPDKVVYCDISTDSKRRDLTCNSLYYDIDKKEIIDFHGGVEDLKKGVIKTVGKPSERFDEDPLRKLRAVRFETRMNAKLDKETLDALKKDNNISQLSGKRIMDEFTGAIKQSKNTKVYLERCDEIGFTKQILPGLKVSKPYPHDNNYHTFISFILRDNDPSKVGKTLNKINYSNDDKDVIVFLISLKGFSPDKIVVYKKLHDNIKKKNIISDSDIVEFGKRIGKKLEKFVKFDLSVKGDSVPKDLKGPEIGLWIKNREKELFMKESILTEGGAYGHMSHPFDTDINLTFGQLKDIVNRALEGTLEFTREKTDGQALAISWRDGRLVAARNKGHLKNKGENALDIKGVSDKFQGRGGLSDAYNYAMKDLSNAIKALSDKQRDKIFKQGACFMNLEVIYPTSVNVIPYGQALLVFHGTMEYNDEGVAIGENGEAARILAGMIKQVNKDVQDNYTIQGPPVVQLPKSQDLSKKRAKYSSQISKLQKEFRLKDTDGVADYHQAWWEQWVDKNSPLTLDNKTKMGLVKRWAFMDKKFRLDKNTIKDEKVLQWAQKTDKDDQSKISKQNLMKFEQIFLGLGAEVLEFTSSALTVNPDKAVRDIKKRIDQTIKDVKKSGDPKKIEKLKLELGRLNSIGGTNKIVPNEGIVFLYNGNTFKLTGTFASVNQILGIFF